MDFNPNNPIIQRCLQAMAQEAQGNPEKASTLFMQALDEAANDFERYLAAYFLARHQNNATDKLKWLQTSLQLALSLENESVRSAYATLYTEISDAYRTFGDLQQADHYHQLAATHRNVITDTGPFFHGTKADLKVGDLLTPGNRSNYQPEIIMNHIYFTALLDGAGLAAALAQGDGPERVYIVEPTGKFEHDPNVTDKKFPGNPTRSYRTLAPLKITGEINDWAKQTPEAIQHWRDKLAKNKRDIIN